MRIHLTIPILLLAASALAQSPATAPTLLPIPNPSQQSRARDLIYSLYKTDFAKKAAADRLALAKLLLTQATQTTDDPSARYIALTESADLAASVGDAPTAFAAIDQLAHAYAINPLDLKRQALAKSQSAAATPEQSESILRLALDTADQAALLDAFDSVQQLVNLAESAANKTRQVRIVTAIQIHLATLRDLIAEFPKVRAAFTRLDQNPSDADAHLAVGTFYALHKAQWSLGLPHLAQSNDPKLQPLATQELAHPTDGLAQTALGDAWWDFAQSSTGITRTTTSAHAADWYKSAQTSLQGITLTRIQSRIQSAQPTATPSTTVPAPTAGPIDLLALIDPAKDAGQGLWSRTGNALACDSVAYATLQLPYTTPEEFDLTATFTRTEGNGPIALVLATHKRTFDFALDVKGEARFERVDNKIAKDNPTTVPVSLSNNRRYTLTIEIRKDHLRALLDGKPLTEWKTDYKDLSRYTVWKLPDPTLPALGVNNAKVTFHAIQLTVITGKGKPSR